MDAIWSSNLASKCPPRAPPTPQNHAPVHTRTQIQQIAFCALQVLLGCFLAALGAFLSAFWAQLEASWAPLGLNLGPLGRLWSSSWGVLGASWAPLGASWAPPAPTRGILGAKWTSNGRQLGASKAPFGRHNGCQCQHTPLECQNSCPCPAHLSSPALQPLPAQVPLHNFLCPAHSARRRHVLSSWGKKTPGRAANATCFRRAVPSGACAAKLNSKLDLYCPVALQVISKWTPGRAASSAYS